MTLKIRLNAWIVKTYQNMKRVPGPDRFRGLEEWLQRWLTYEQTVNERLTNHRVYRPIDHRLPPHLRPAAQPVWEQEVVWLPEKLTRSYGPVAAGLRAAFGLDIPKGRAPLFLHPQTIAAHRRLGREYGRNRLPEIVATPTSSYRSLVAWRRDGQRAPVVLKLSLGAIVQTIRRAFREEQIVRALVISKLFEEIPRKDLERHQFDWFREFAGVVETRSGHGWMLRRLPDSLRESTSTTAVSLFSLISRREKRPPLLAELIARSGLNPEVFVVQRVLIPYVRAHAYLLFEQGLAFEGHTQNVLMEIDRSEGLTGRLLFRDLSDTFVNIPWRVARGRPLPVFPKKFLSDDVPFSVVMNAYTNRYDRPVLVRGYLTVEQFGLSAVVWAINTSLKRFFKQYDARFVVTRYLELWQEAAIESLQRRPLFRKQPRGLATDEAITDFLTETDWRALGASPAHLHRNAIPLRIDRRMRRQPGKIYDRLDCPWGDLYMMNGLPGFIRPAF